MIVLLEGPLSLADLKLTLNRTLVNRNAFQLEKERLIRFTVERECKLTLNGRNEAWLAVFRHFFPILKLIRNEGNWKNVQRMANETLELEKIVLRAKEQTEHRRKTAERIQMLRKSIADQLNSLPKTDRQD